MAAAGSGRNAHVGLRSSHSVLHSSGFGRCGAPLSYDPGCAFWRPAMARSASRRRRDLEEGIQGVPVGGVPTGFVGVMGDGESG